MQAGGVQSGTGGIAEDAENLPSPDRPGMRSAIAGWMRQRIVANFAKVLTGQFVVTVCAFATLALNSRALGVEALGVLLLIQGACMLVSRVFAAQNWQAMVKFGALAIANGGRRDLMRIWRAGLALDIGCGLIAALAVFVLFEAAPGLIGLSEQQGEAARWFAASVALAGATAGLGILRLAQRFGLTSFIQITQSVLLLANAAILLAVAAPLDVYLVTVPILSVIAPLWINVMGWNEVRRLAASMEYGGRDDRIPMREVLGFSVGMSLNGTLNVVRNRGELLAVGAVLGPAAAGTFGVAFSLASLALRVADAARQAVYPEIAARVSRGNTSAAASLVRRSILAAAAVAIPALVMVALLGESLLVIAFGPGFESAYVDLLLLAAGQVVLATVFAIPPLMELTMGTLSYLRFNALITVPFIIGAFAGPLLIGHGGVGAICVGLAFAVAAYPVLNATLADQRAARP